MMTPIDATTMPLLRRVYRGKCSQFGGPADTGMKPDEGLALIEETDLDEPYFGRLFLPRKPGVGLGRSLNPNAFFCAMRWDEIFDIALLAQIACIDNPALVAAKQVELRRAVARDAMVRLSFGPGTASVWLQPADFGPNPNTGRIIDCSAAGLKRIGATTDNDVTAEVFA